MIRTVVVAMIILFHSGQVLADSSFGELFQKSRTWETKGDYTSALVELEKIAPKEVYILQLRLGWVLYNLERYDDSISAYRKAIKLEPGSLEARLGLMLPQMATRRWVDAKAIGEEILRHDPGSYLARSRLAYINYIQASFKDAEKLYRDLVGYYPGDLDMRNGLGWTLYKQGRYQEAKEVFKKVLEISPENPSALEGIGYCP